MGTQKREPDELAVMSLWGTESRFCHPSLPVGHRLAQSCWEYIDCVIPGTPSPSQPALSLCSFLRAVKNTKADAVHWFSDRSLHGALPFLPGSQLLRMLHCALNLLF